MHGDDTKNYPTDESGGQMKNDDSWCLEYIYQFYFAPVPDPNPYISY